MTHLVRNWESTSPSPILQQRSMEKATSTTPDPSRTVPSSQVICHGNNPVNSSGGFYEKMMKSLARTLTNTNSGFWRIYELVSSAVFLVLLSCVTVFLIGEKSELVWTVKVLIWSVVGIVIIDVLKYRITGSAKDKPLRKWFSFRWAQRYRPEETLSAMPRDIDMPLSRRIQRPRRRAMRPFGITHTS